MERPTSTFALMIETTKAWATTPEGAAAIAERRANPKPLGPPSPPWHGVAGGRPQMPGIAVLTVGGRLVSPAVVGLS